MSNKICRKQKIKFLTLPLTKKDRERERERERVRERRKNMSNFKNFNSKTPEKLSLVTLVTNVHKLSLLPLAVRS